MYCYAVVVLIAALITQTFTATTKRSADELRIQPMPPPGMVHHIRQLGHSFVLTCSASSSNGAVSSAYISWKDNVGNTVPERTGSRIYAETSPDGNGKKLFITDIRASDEGSYSCMSSINGVQYEKNVSLVIHKPITFDNAPHEQHLRLGSTSLIYCIVSGVPRPTVSWRFRGRRLISSERHTILPDGLQISGVNADDEGTYTCRAAVDSDGMYADRAIRVSVDANIDDRSSDGGPEVMEPWMMCLIRVQMLCVPSTLNSPDGLQALFEQLITHHLNATCGPLLEMKKCAAETLNSCDETALQSVPSMLKKYIDTTMDVVDYVCHQHINAFEQYESCLFGTDLDGSTVYIVAEMYCPQEIHQLLYQDLEELCSSDSPPDLSCIYRVIQNKCGTPIADLLKELATKMLRGCSADIRRSNRKLSMLQRYLHLYHTRH